MMGSELTPNHLKHCLLFDSSKQLDLYDETVRIIVDAVLQGYNGMSLLCFLNHMIHDNTGTIFAYGQTGTGKTYTMEGIRSSKEQRGIIPNSFEHIFSHISQSENQVCLKIFIDIFICNNCIAILGKSFIFRDISG